MSIHFLFLLLLTTYSSYGQKSPIGYFQSPGIWGKDIEILADSTYKLHWRSCTYPTHTIEEAEGGYWTFNGNKLIIHGLTSENAEPSDSVFILRSNSVLQRASLEQIFVKTTYYRLDGSLKLYIPNPVLDGNDSIIGGEVHQFHKGGLVLNVYSIQNGEKNGLEELFYEESLEQLVKRKDIQSMLPKIINNGYLPSDRAFLTSFFVQKKHSGNWTNGLKDGEWNYYYDNGEIERKEFWKSGEKVKKWLFYDRNGSLMRKEKH